jgi:hypothetical protein
MYTVVSALFWECADGKEHAKSSASKAAFRARPVLSFFAPLSPPRVGAATPTRLGKKPGEKR